MEQHEIVRTVHTPEGDLTLDRVEDDNGVSYGLIMTRVHHDNCAHPIAVFEDRETAFVIMSFILARGLVRFNTAVGQVKRFAAQMEN